MTKIAVISDTHFGARNDSPIFLEHFMRFWEEVFFPTLEERGITRIIHMGDFMDRRKFVNFHTLNQVRTRFVDAMEKKGITMDLVLGNHDAYYRNTINLNSPHELLHGRACVRVHATPSVIEVDGVKLGLVPWIAKANQDECLDFIASKPSKVLFGHFEVSGCEPIRGIQHEGGMSPSLFADYDSVYSGHFHCKHSRENIHYLGTQYQMTFSDLGETKGFHIYRPSDDTMDFVPNPMRMFDQITYDDSEKDYTTFNCTPYKDSFVRIMVRSKSRPIMYDNLLDRLNAAPVHGITVIDGTEKQVQTDPTKVDMSKDTLTLICEEIDAMENVLDPTRLKTMIREIYAESMQG